MAGNDFKEDDLNMFALIILLYIAAIIIGFLSSCSISDSDYGLAPPQTEHCGCIVTETDSGYVCVEYCKPVEK